MLKLSFFRERKIKGLDSGRKRARRNVSFGRASGTVKPLHRKYLRLRGNSKLAQRMDPTRKLDGLKHGRRSNRSFVGILNNRGDDEMMRVHVIPERSRTYHGRTRVDPDKFRRILLSRC